MEAFAAMSLGKAMTGGELSGKSPSPKKSPLKIGGVNGKKWKEKHVVLDAARLIVSPSATSNKVEKTLNLTDDFDIDVVVNPTPKKGDDEDLSTVVVKIVTHQQTLMLRAESEGQAVKWKETIQEAASEAESTPPPATKKTPSKVAKPKTPKTPKSGKKGKTHQKLEKEEFGFGKLNDDAAVIGKKNKPIAGEEEMFGFGQTSRPSSSSPPQAEKAVSPAADPGSRAAKLAEMKAKREAKKRGSVDELAAILAIIDNLPDE